MCFSATASFSAGIVLAVAGIIAIRNTKHTSQLMFAAIPLLFSIQQFTEGFVWLALTHHKEWQHIPIHIFLIFAQVLWPLWVPVSMLQIERSKIGRKLLSILVVIGASVSLYLLYTLISYNVSAAITPYHIHYELDFPTHFQYLVAGLYFLTTVVPPFLLKGKRMISLGLLNLASFVITMIFFDQYVISIWCFFAALISWEVILVIKELNKSSNQVSVLPVNV